MQTLLKQITAKRSSEHFEFLLDKTKKYAIAINRILEDVDDVEVSVDFEKKRISKKKKMPD